MTASADLLPCHLEACDALTAFGDADASTAALLAGRRALALTPVLGQAGGDPVPLALRGPLDETLPPRWLEDLQVLAKQIPAGDWGRGRTPVVVTSCNFGVGSLYAYQRERDPRHVAPGAPFAAVELLQKALGWGDDLTVFSHACVTSHLGLYHAARLLHADLADRVLVFTYDFLSPFVTGGFHSLKILNQGYPAPYSVGEMGSIGLGDGAAFAVLRRGVAAKGGFTVQAHALYNEMFHVTGNQPDGSGFAACTAAIAAASGGRRVWVKGHGTGTLEAGRLEAEMIARQFPGSPLVSWKGGLGHTLGSCGLVELAITVRALRQGRIPGTVGGTAPTFGDHVALESFAADAFDGVILTSNAFGGAHAVMLLTSP